MCVATVLSRADTHCTITDELGFEHCRQLSHPGLIFTDYLPRHRLDSERASCKEQKGHYRSCIKVTDVPEHLWR
ncbi:hypothetical protein PF005_g10669 [Phytophthora fragariae]|uniref:Uncharacterized protein n=1 Tax=Phytophthora fragariae TaxID=53985 RepID=A0A6A3Y4Z4_9STRA|nr:hypothetical protein PF009_g15131 [Phytophthora fragariae]KAE9003633.1 hypothetical protein PF011_g12815 [Phytophthora fragariae]KAE9212252.1 hypothetical protein PF005_g10669 [Phytophthora fragariae]KAE9221170.1 hypothetical protein PF004_g13115 [Phytophthora fragariae]KAE9222655.1 hypothetical protein PF002_g15190 [Phytophthora fragariae]